MKSPKTTDLITKIIKWNDTTQTIATATKYERNINDTNNPYSIRNNSDITENNLLNSVRNESDFAEDVLNLCNDIKNVTNITLCDIKKYDGIEISVVVILFILIVIIVIGNTLIISAVVTTKRLRTVTNCFVTSLAVADLLVGIFVMPPAIAVHIRGKWELGWILCDIWISLDILLCTASILSLCAISIDRYLAVTRPLTYSRRRRSKKLALTMILFVWAAATAITCPPIFGWYEPDHNQGGICRYNQNPGYVVFSAMGSFFLPMGVMVYVYARISCVVARRHHQLSTTNSRCSKKSKLNCLKPESDSGSEKLSLRKTSSLNQSSISHKQTNQTECTNHEQCCCKHEKRGRSFKNQNKTEKNSKMYQGEFSYKYRCGGKRNQSMKDHENNRVSSLRRETKTAQTLSFVVGGFVACWLPFFLYYILTPFLPDNYVNPLLMYILTWLGWFNSAINPFIYAFYSPDFRLAFWRLTIKKFTKKS